MSEVPAPGAGVLAEVPVLPAPAKRRFLAALTSPQVLAIQPTSAIVLLPVASVEQHGPHLPLYTDCLITEAILEGALERLQDRLNVWTLPLLAYGKSNEHIHFPGTITLSAPTLLRVLSEIAQSLRRTGFRRLVLLNGHGGNAALLEVAARDIRVETGLMVFVVPSGLRLGVPEGRIAPKELSWGLHAGELETSAVMAIAPEAVDVARLSGSLPAWIDRYRRIGPTKGTSTIAWLVDDLAPNGVVGDPRGACVETGRMVIEGAIRHLCATLQEIATFEFSAVATGPVLNQR